MDPLYLVRLAGIEPTTPWFVAKYSIQLSYSRERQNYSIAFIHNGRGFKKSFRTGILSIASAYFIEPTCLIFATICFMMMLMIFDSLHATLA
jgi:hypothetical protein